MFLGVVSKERAKICEVGAIGNRLGDRLILRSCFVGARRGQSIEEILGPVVAEANDGLWQP
jgi:hypothetical protein